MIESDGKQTNEYDMETVSNHHQKIHGTLNNLSKWTFSHQQRKNRDRDFSEMGISTSTVKIQCS
jgi:hypothetical protein